MTYGEKRRTIRMADDIWRALGEHADASGRTASDVIRELVRERVGMPAPPQPISPLSFAAGAALLALGVPPDRIEEAWDVMRKRPIPMTMSQFVRQAEEAAASVR